MPLERREIEIPLTGGQNTAEVAEIQDMSTMRLAENVVHRTSGVEKRPRIQRVAAGTAHTANGTSAPNRIGGIITHGDKFFALHEQHGPMRAADGGEDRGSLAPVYASRTHTASHSRPFDRVVPARVSRSEVGPVAGSGYSVFDTGTNRSVISATVCEYVPASLSGGYQPSVVVHAWLELTENFSGSGTDQCYLRMVAVDYSTGEPVCQPMSVACASSVIPSAQDTFSVLSMSYEETNYKGVLILYPYSMTGGAVDYAISRWDWTTKAFVGSTTVVATTYATSPHGIDIQPNTGILANSGATSFLLAYVGAGATYYPIVETRTMAGGVSATYTGGAAAIGGVALAVGTTYPGLFSHDGNVPANIYAERVSGAGPATRLTVRTSTANEVFSAVTAARDYMVQSGVSDTGHTAWVAFNVSSSIAGLLGNTFTGVGSATIDYACNVEACAVNFSSNPPTAVTNGTTRNTRIPGSLATRADVVSGRCTFGVQACPLTVTERRLTTTICVVQPYFPDVAALSDWDGCRYSIIARLGHDRAVHQGVFTAAVIGWHLPQIARCGISDTFRVSYPVDQIAGRSTTQARGTAVLANKVQMTYCSPEYDEAHGASWVASGVLARLDGQTVKVASYQAPPSVGVHLQTATARGWTADDYSVIAVYQTVDAAGNVYRSAPSSPVSFTTTGTEEPRFIVTWPLDSSAEGNPSARPKVQLYISTGGSYYPLDDGAGMWIDAWSEYSWGAEFRTDNGAAIYTANTSGAPLYSSGATDEELVSEPPPSLLSIAAVGDRLWGVDAEDRSRVWFTKPFSAGIAPEWNTVCTLTVADELVAVRDVAGVPTLFGKSGMWQVYGEGPNALGAGSFAPPRRLPHTVVAYEPQGVCRTLAGAAVMTTGGLVMFDGQGLENFGWPIDSTYADTKLQYSALTGMAVTFDAAQNEVRVFSAGTAYVFSLDAKKWSAWTQDGPIDNRAKPAANRSGVMMMAPDQATPEVWKVYEDSIGTHKVKLTTPHFKLDGLAGFGRVWEIWVVVRNQGVGTGNSYRSSLLVTLTYDYGDASSTHTIANTDLDLADNKSLVVTRVWPTQQKMRALQVQVEETTPFSDASGSYGLVPIALRIVYGADSGRNRGRAAAVG